MLRLASYGVGSSSTPAAPTSPTPTSPNLVDAATSPVASPPLTTTTSASSPGQQPPPHQLLISRTHELRRIATGLATWFTNLAQLHHEHSLLLSKLAPLTTPFKENALFIPLHSPDDAGSSKGDDDGQLGGTGQEGWQDIFHQANSTSTRVSAHHAQLAKDLQQHVVAPLNKLAFELKSHGQLLERDLQKPVDAVQRERDLVQPLYSRLDKAIAHVAKLASKQEQKNQLAASTSSSWSFSLGSSSSSSSASSQAAIAGKPLAAAEDPVLLRAHIEARLRVLLDREHDLAALVRKWTEKCNDRELAAFETVKVAWSQYERLNSAILLESQQLGMFLAATVDAVPLDAEWQHFVEKRLPATAVSAIEGESERTVDQVEWAGKGHDLTKVVKEGLLERQTSILKSWKPAYFILTPAGILHVYGPPPSSVNLAEPEPAASSSEHEGAAEPDSSAIKETPLSPTAQYLILHSSPHISLNLSQCFLGPMPTPQSQGPPSPSPAEIEAGTAAPVTPPATRPPALDAVFTLIEATVVGKELTMTSSGARHVVRCKGENGWEEMGGWVAEIGKFCAVPSAPPPPSPPTPTQPVMLTVPSLPENEHLGGGIDTEREEDIASSAPSHARAVPPLPNRSVPPLPPRDFDGDVGRPIAGGFDISTLTGPPPALPPRDSFLSQTSSTSSVTRHSLLMSDSEAGDASYLDGSDIGGGGSGGDLSHALASFGFRSHGTGQDADEGLTTSEVEGGRSHREREDTPATTIHDGDTDVEKPSATPSERGADDADETHDEHVVKSDHETEGDLGQSAPEEGDAHAGDQIGDKEEDESAPVAAEEAAESTSAAVSEAEGGDESDTSAFEPSTGGEGDHGDEQSTPNPSEGGGLTVPKSKKGKKKRKSKGKETSAPATPPNEPETTETGDAQPSSAPGSPKAEPSDEQPEAATEDSRESKPEDGADGSKNEGDDNSEEVKPPLELEEVEEAPEHIHDHEQHNGTDGEHNDGEHKDGERKDGEHAEHHHDSENHEHHHQ